MLRSPAGSAYDRVVTCLTQFDGLIARSAQALVEHCRRLTGEIDELTSEMSQRTQ